MKQEEHIIRIGTSPMTPAQPLVGSWPKLQQLCPEDVYKRQNHNIYRSIFATIL